MTLVLSQQLPVAKYSASAVDKTTQVFFLQCHEIKLEPNK